VYSEKLNYINDSKHMHIANKIKKGEGAIPHISSSAHVNREKKRGQYAYIYLLCLHGPNTYFSTPK
jgi:hypothetical protein